MEHPTTHHTEHGENGHSSSDSHPSAAGSPPIQSVESRLACAGSLPTVTLPDDSTDSIVAEFRELVRTVSNGNPDISNVTAEIDTALNLNPQLRDGLAEYALRSLIKQTIYELRYTERKAVKFAPPKPCGYSPSAVARDSQDKLKSILDHWTFNGKHLGEVTGEEMKDIAAKHREIARGHARDAKFFSLLAKLTPNNKTVREAVGSKADKLWEKIKTE